MGTYGNRDMCHDAQIYASSVFQDELKLAMNQGTTLLSCIRDQASKSENHKLNPDEVENQTTVERCAYNCCFLNRRTFFPPNYNVLLIFPY